MSNWLLDEMKETKGFKSDNWLLDEMQRIGEDTEYNAFRSATVDFIESAVRCRR